MRQEHHLLRTYLPTLHSAARAAKVVLAGRLEGFIYQPYTPLNRMAP